MLERLQRLSTWLTEPLEQRSAELDPSISYPDVDALLFERQRARRGTPGAPTVAEALGQPAIYRSVSLLSSATGSLNLVEYQNQTPLPVASTVVRRPNSEWTPGSFWWVTGQDMATYGEAIWLITKRDVAGLASNIVPVPPFAMRSEWDGVRLTWFSKKDGRDVEQDPRNVVHIPLIRDRSTGRGKGPLQACGAAVTVSVEADNWARRWFVGGMPSLYLDSAMPIDELEATTVKDQWLTDPPNIPKVGYGFDPKQIGWSVEQAQLNGARMFNRGEVALMFGIPGRLLEYAESGTSVTYANVGDLATELVRLTLAPLYLEQIEQAFSDLLPRGHEVRFDVEGFQRADVKTRYEVYEKAIALGIITPEQAAVDEGKAPGSREVEPTPLRRVV